MSHLFVGLGEVLWDVRQQVDSFAKSPGGAPANFAYHVGQLGGGTCVVSCIGEDEDGRELLTWLSTFASSDYVCVDPAHSTGRVTVTLGSEGIPSYTIRENVAWDFIRLTPEVGELAGRVDAACFGTLAQRSEVSRATIQAFLDLTSPDALRIFDVNLRQSFYSPEVIEESLQRATVLKLNGQELPIVAKIVGCSMEEDVTLPQLAERYGLRLVALTKGKDGSVLYSAGRMSVHNGCAVRPVDTVGAGDAFTAALATGMLRQLDLDLINEWANRVAAYVCSQPGATPELPDELRLPYASMEARKGSGSLARRLENC